ncbi:MAG: D-glycero-beta-D-manno-heptose-7-phosphate kinase [Deltaproteobacteria bacterium HGW-Deltaproteobacteria-15]|jgi:D-beta-D-heptose 7-phosphate kinase/D-beta-D-heptose 1-phosphate adenosyltransferase|nr:MAG: D-glycero-beta-D-manno-heptose-7-phosphate kinase [Deltaproteobacteria bacterium HGW-Deltaproteobacteria-15]
MSRIIREIGSEYNPHELAGYVDKFPKTTILVVGDIILDEYIWGDVNRISPEAPVPVVEVRDETKMLGGAANVVSNIASLGGKAVLCGITGSDDTAREIENRIRSLGFSTGGILAEAGRVTSIKTRIVAHNQQVVRYDRESRRDIRSETAKRLLKIAERYSGVDGVIVSDYGKGVVSGSLMRGLRSLLRKRGAVFAVDPKTGNFEYYRGVDVITPNHHEAGAFCGFRIHDEKTLIKAGRHMLKELNCRSVLITQGRDGMTLFENGGEISHIPTVARKVFDVTGAGDTVISTFCLGLASGMDLKSAAIISNMAAGIVVGEVGTSTVKAEELKKNIHRSLKNSHP